ncbi:aldo/keto reductase [Nonomuraea angiospora]|uniref:aldo/keto reductase n=1 Tax=Nonomuraea angiospora TaxID=46172 RepID=UPI0033CB6E8F
MQYVRLGTSGLKVSRIALGCMSFGRDEWNPWALTEEQAAPIFRQAVETGITLWDTANAYGSGASEEIVGRAITKYSRREDVVLATKVFFPVHGGPGGAGLSRKAIMEQIDASLARLGTDYVDLYQIHRFDPDTPVEETMEALHDVIKAGKARYIGASSMWAWQLAKMRHTARSRGRSSFISMQHQYSLMQREEEREMFPLLADEGLGSLIWSPLARGRLTRPWGQATTRSGNDPISAAMLDQAQNRPIADAVQDVAENRGIPMARIAMAWLLRNPVVTAPIIGATRPEHLADAVAALDIDLTPDEARLLEAPYTPRTPSGY